MKTRTELENELKLLESGAAAIREQLAAMPKQWELEGGDYFIDPDGLIMDGVSVGNYRSFGTERKTREEAERAAIEMRKFNRLLAYRDEFAPGHEPDWSDDSRKYYIYQQGIARNLLWDTSFNTRASTLCAVYMPEGVANELCRKLNSGEVVL